MAILSFSLNPNALNKLYDVLVCLGKFSEYVSMEASQQKLVLSALNSTKSAYASFTLRANSFFSRYNYFPELSEIQRPEKFDFRIYNRALISVFKGRFVDQTKEKETAVEKCDIYIDDDENLKSRFVIKITCRHGVRKNYRLIFESLPLMHANFDKKSAKNNWKIFSKILREVTEHFGPGTEQLDIYLADGRVNFTSFTEKIISGNELLKKPLHTTIAMNTLEFSEFSVEELLHIVINVKDFKAIIAHCGIANVMVNVSYSQPSNPIQLTYELDGIISEFILMTIGDPKITPTPNHKQKGTKDHPSEDSIFVKSRKRKVISEVSHQSSVSEGSTHLRVMKSSPPPPEPSIQSESLFLPQADHDRKWEPLDFDRDESEMLLWDASEKESTTLDFARKILEPSISNERVNFQPIVTKPDNDGSDESLSQGLPPTQKSSQVRLKPLSRV